MGSLKSIQSASQAMRDAEEALRSHCQRQFDAYVGWVGTDESFWLSFVRGCGNERAGGLLDALAKICKLNVFIWSEKLGLDPELELVHEVNFGSKVVHLWYQGGRGHFDRLVPCCKKKR